MVEPPPIIVEPPPIMVDPPDVELPDVEPPDLELPVLPPLLLLLPQAASKRTETIRTPTSSSILFTACRLTCLAKNNLPILLLGTHPRFMPLARPSASYQLRGYGKHER